MILSLAAIAVVAFACQWLAWRVKLPAILFLLLSGILLGPATGWLNPDQLFGDLLFPLISLSVAIILFEGSLTLNIGEIRNQGKVVRHLIVFGATITWAIVAITTHYLFGLGWELSVLFGALTVVTGPTVIVPLLRTVRPHADIANILRWEGILIDPIGALLVVVVYEFIATQSGANGISHGLVIFVKVIGFGLVFGLAGGAFLEFIMRKRWIPDFLLNLATLSILFGVFSFSDYLAHESGLLAVTVMGMWLANRKNIHIEEILNFKENLSVVLISGLFILLAARLTFQEISALGWTSIILLLVMQFVARPLSVLASTTGSSLSWRQKAMLAWIAPRGIVAAAVSALFAIQLQNAGVENANILVPLTFIVIIGTVVLQSATARPLARMLKVAEPSPSGLLIVGANTVARAIGKALHDKGFRVLLADSSWDNISAARMEGLETFYGNVVSEYADQHLDLVGIGKMLGLSPRRGVNAVAGMRYATEFGRHNVYVILTAADTKVSERHQLAVEHRGYVLFGDEITYQKLASLLSQGAEVKTTKLSDEFTFELFKQQHNKTIPLFAISPKGRIQIFVKDGDFTPSSGWVIISLTPAPPKESDNIKMESDNAKMESETKTKGSP
jgi:NhaP-type Na+/H+ or K+/H+ antiporter